LIDSWHSRSDEIAKLKKKSPRAQMLVRREAAIRDRWDNMRANALPNNPTVAERQFSPPSTTGSRTGGVTEGSFRPQVQEGDTNFPPWIAGPTSAAIWTTCGIFSKP
jgi:hypothetical protein